MHGIQLVYIWTVGKLDLHHQKTSFILMNTKHLSIRYDKNAKLNLNCNFKFQLIVSCKS